MSIWIHGYGKLKQVINHLFEKVYSFLDKKRKLTILLVTVVLLISVFRLFSASFNNDVELMLPKDAEFSRSLKFLRESDFSDKIVLSLHLKGEDKTVADLIKAADQLKNSLKSPLIRKIEEGIVENEVLGDIEEFLGYVPQIVSAEDLFAVEKEINPKNVKERLKQGYKNMLSMNSMFMKYFIQNDPLGFKTKYLRKIKDLAESIGYQAQFKHGHFVSIDEKNVMLILSTSVLITDSANARKLINHIREQIKLLPDYIDVDIIGGHLHTISNEDILKRDISKTVFAVTLILLILLILVFRSVRALLVFIIPAAAIVISMNIASMTMGSLSPFVVGLAAVIAGITVDYGIHIYLAMQSGGMEKVNKIAKPILVGVFTTMGVFASFFFSSIYGFQQFALLTNLSIIVSIFFYLFILPRLFYEKKKRIPFAKMSFRNKHHILGDRAMVLLWIIILSAFVLFSQNSTFSNDIRVYDGSSKSIFDAEERFRKMWGANNEFAMLVAQAPSKEKVLKVNEALNMQMKKSFRSKEFSSIADIYPSLETRAKNLSRWDLFWKNKHGEELGTLLREQGSDYGYSEDAFKPFFDSLYTSHREDAKLQDPKLLDRVKRRFLQKTEGGNYAITYFPDKKVFVDKAREISSKMADAFVISRNSMAKSISESAGQEVKKLSWIAGLLIVILTILLLKSIRLTLLALLPVVTSIFMIIGGFSLLGYSLNAPSMIAILVVAGLCIDYGVFMVYDCKFKLEARTFLAVTLSAATTIAGGSVLLLATHPVLFYVGVTMAIGIFSGYLAAAFVIPACYRLWISPGGTR
ncbi:MAG: MMPL family transporter [Candidatus Aceula meridiana]|nr:MMPL family transporter [Candidatus Aceula meridiana]